MPLEVRLISDADHKAINDFFNHARHVDRQMKQQERKFDEFSWEFIHGPCGKAIYAVALDAEEGKETRIAGIQAVIPFVMVTAGGRSILTAKGEDTLIDIRAQLKYKNKDILRELYDLLFEECRRKNITLVWGFNTAYASYKRLGFDHAVRSYYGALVLKPFRAYKNYLCRKNRNERSGNLRMASLLVFAFLFSLKRFFIRSHPGNFLINTELNENTGLFKRAAGPHDLFYIKQDDEYLKWRISENPYPVKYRSYQLMDADHVLRAQLICSINKNEAFVEQLLFDEELDSKVVFCLLKEMIRKMRKDNLCIIRNIGFQNNAVSRKEMSTLKKLGFVYSGKGEQVSMVSLAGDPEIGMDHIYLSRLYKQGID
jgi:hypothetical protein